MMLQTPRALITTLFILSSVISVAPQSGSTKQDTPNTLVSLLYQQHNHKHSPFFQTRSRALVSKYFEKSLADLIWKDAVHSKGEVGAIDGDPLYDAQDMQIKKFAIQKAEQEGDKAKVNVTFENLGQKKLIVFLLDKDKTGWRIRDIDYGGGRTLLGELKETYK